MRVFFSVDFALCLENWFYIPWFYFGRFRPGAYAVVLLVNETAPLRPTCSGWYACLIPPAMMHNATRCALQFQRPNCPMPWILKLLYLLCSWCAMCHVPCAMCLCEFWKLAQSTNSKPVFRFVQKDSSILFQKSLLESFGILCTVHLWNSSPSLHSTKPTECKALEADECLNVWDVRQDPDKPPGPNEIITSILSPFDSLKIWVRFDTGFMAQISSSDEP